MVEIGGNMDDNKQISTDLRGQMELGQVFFESGLFPDIKTKAQSVVKIMAGAELGLSPFQSMSGIYMVNGKLALQANVMSSLIKRSKKYDYLVTKLDNEECTITFKQGDQSIGESTFTFKDAAKAGLANRDNWKSYSRNMLFARALSNGARWFCPDVICGWHSVEELDDNPEPTVEPAKTTVAIDVSGEVVNGQASA